MLSSPAPSRIAIMSQNPSSLDIKGQKPSDLEYTQEIRSSNPASVIPQPSSSLDVAPMKSEEGRTTTTNTTDTDSSSKTLASPSCPSSSLSLLSNPISSFIRTYSQVSFFSPNLATNLKNDQTSSSLSSNSIEPISIISDVTKSDSSTFSPLSSSSGARDSPSPAHSNSPLAQDLQPSSDQSQVPLSIGRLFSRLPGLSIDFGLSQLLSPTNSSANIPTPISSDSSQPEAASALQDQFTPPARPSGDQRPARVSSSSSRTPVIEAGDPIQEHSVSTTPQPARRGPPTSTSRPSTPVHKQPVPFHPGSTPHSKENSVHSAALDYSPSSNRKLRGIFSRGPLSSSKTSNGSGGTSKKFVFSKLRWAKSTPKPRDPSDSPPRNYARKSVSSLRSSTNSHSPTSYALAQSTSTCHSVASSLGSTSGERYIKVKKHQKNQEKQFGELFLAQELSARPVVEIKLDLGRSKSEGEEEDDDEVEEMVKGRRLDSSFRSTWSVRKRSSGPDSKIKITNRTSRINSGTSESFERETKPTREPTKTKSGKLSQSKSAIWALEFSKQASYLASAGEDGTINVWALRGTKRSPDALERRISSRSGSLTSTSTESSVAALPKNSNPQNSSLTPIFDPIVHQRFSDHEAGVLSLSWSKNDFLLSASKDRTVRLWHVERPDCLGIFEHPDLVTSVMFHPTDDRYFISGGVDRKLRLWNIVEKNVVVSRDLSHCITSLNFSIDGKSVLVGLFSGEVLTLDCETLKPHRKDRRSSSFSMESRNGRKVTSVNEIGKKVFMVSSNDSKIVIKNQYEDLVELGGHSNNESQIRAGIREGFDGQSKFVISGSEDRGIHLWSIKEEGDGDQFEQRKKSRVGHESFYPRGSAKNSITTCAVLAPAGIEDRLMESGDKLMKEIKLRQDEGTRRPSEGLIIVSADDCTGKIRIYRNGGL